MFPFFSCVTTGEQGQDGGDCGGVHALQQDFCRVILHQMFSAGEISLAFVLIFYFYFEDQMVFNATAVVLPKTHQLTQKNHLNLSFELPQTTKGTKKFHKTDYHMHLVTDHHTV